MSHLSTVPLHQRKKHIIGTIDFDGFRASFLAFFAGHRGDARLWICVDCTKFLCYSTFMAKNSKRGSPHALFSIAIVNPNHAKHTVHSLPKSPTMASAGSVAPFGLASNPHVKVK